VDRQASDEPLVGYRCVVARALWTGTIAVGMVQIPIRLLTAVRPKGISFNQLDERDGARIRMRRVSEDTGEEVPSEHIVRGIEVENRGWIVIGDDDLDSLKPVKSNEVAVGAFVPAAQIPAALYGKSYWVAPGKGGAHAYALLVEAMADSNRVAIAQFVMRSTEYLAAVRSDGERLSLSTMSFPDELVTWADAEAEAGESIRTVSLTERERKMAVGLVEALSDDWDPSQFQDTYRAEVMALIEAKAAGTVFVSSEAPAETGHVVDLAAALEASMEAAKAARQRHPTARKATAKKPAAGKRRKTA